MEIYTESHTDICTHLDLDTILQNKDVYDLFTDHLRKEGAVSQLQFFWAVNGLFALGENQTKLMKQIYTKLLPETKGISQSILQKLDKLNENQDFNHTTIADLLSSFKEAQDQVWAYTHEQLIPSFRLENDAIQTALSYAKHNSGAFSNVMDIAPSVQENEQLQPTPRSLELKHRERRTRNRELDNIARNNPLEFGYLVFQKMDQFINQGHIYKIPTAAVNSNYNEITRNKSSKSDEEDLEHILNNHVNNVLEKSKSPRLTLVQNSSLAEPSNRSHVEDNVVRPAHRLQFHVHRNKTAQGSKWSLDSAISGLSAGSSNREIDCGKNSTVQRHTSMSSLDSGISSQKSRASIWDQLREYNEKFQITEVEGQEEAAAALSSSHSSERSESPKWVQSSSQISDRSKNETRQSTSTKYEQHFHHINKGSTENSQVHFQQHQRQFHNDNSSASKFISTIVTFQQNDDMNSMETFLFKIPIRQGDAKSVPLNVFKRSLPRKLKQGFRFFFKSKISDPDIGLGPGDIVVNEEVVEDDEMLPLLNNKIVCFIKV